MNLSWWNGSTTFPNTTTGTTYTTSPTTTQVPAPGQPQTLDRFVQQVVTVPGPQQAAQTIITSPTQQHSQGVTQQQQRIYPTQIIKVEGNTDDVRPNQLSAASLPAQWSIPGNTISLSLAPAAAVGRTTASGAVTSQPQQFIHQQQPQQGATVLANTQNGTPMLPAFKCAMCEFWTNTEFLLRRHLETVHNATMVKVERDDSIPAMSQGQSHHPPVVQAAIASTTHNLANVGFLAKAIKQEDISQKPTSTLSVVSTTMGNPAMNGINSRTGKPPKKKRFPCDMCDFRTSQKQSLRQHVIAVHEKLRPYNCPWPGCDYNCSRKQNLDKHVMGVHEKLRPYHCPVCDAAFSQKVTLNNHVRGVHERLKPFTCPLCEYACAYRGNLNTHVATVHERRRPHKCDRCGYSCTQRSVLKRHMQAVHDKAHAPIPGVTSHSSNSVAGTLSSSLPGSVTIAPHLVTGCGVLAAAATAVTAADAMTSSIVLPSGATVTTGNFIQPINTVSTVNATSLLHLTTQLPLPTHLQQQLQNGQAQII
jgi:hypothetical protein